MSHIFVSYSRTDEEHATRIVEALREAGHVCWVDTASVPGGGRWLREIARAIEECNAVVALVSDAFVESEWVEEELLYARQFKKEVIPLLLEDRPLPMQLIARQPIPVHGNHFAGGCDRLTAALQRFLPDPSEVRKPSEALSKVERQAAPPRGEETRPTYPPDIALLQDALDDEKTEPPRRAEIGDELANLKDPRRGVGLNSNGLPDIVWQKVPEGPFLYQDGKKLELPTFWMGAYTITNAQYQAFVDDGGYRDERWWDGLAQRFEDPEESRWPHLNQPRTNVSWYEAVAFCRWLSERSAYEVCLPTEEQWEKAARGEDGRVYPWGNEYRSGYANVDETENKDGPWYLERPTAVGMYPQNTSPYGVVDMAGNVWEWCRNEYENPERVQDEGDARRVLRGGSWLYSPDNARASYRDGDRGRPGSRSAAAGFVCVVRPPSLITDSLGSAIRGQRPRIARFGIAPARRAGAPRYPRSGRD